MNRIYSVVWSRSLNQLVVASELAAPRGKVSRGGQKASCAPGTLSVAIMASLLAMGGMGWAGSAQAQSVDCTAAPYNYYSGSATCVERLGAAARNNPVTPRHAARQSILLFAFICYPARGYRSRRLEARDGCGGDAGSTSIASGGRPSNSGRPLSAHWHCSIHG